MKEPIHAGGDFVVLVPGRPYNFGIATRRAEEWQGKRKGVKGEVCYKCKKMVLGCKVKLKSNVIGRYSVWNTKGTTKE